MNKRSSNRSTNAVRSSRKVSHRRLLALEWLEDRKLLSTFTVNNTLDDGSVGSLRWAVGQADATSGANTIAFDSTVFATPKTITLTSGQLTLSDTTGIETITGPAAGVTISGNHTSRVFQVNTSVSAAISGLTISGGTVSGSGLTGSGGGVLNSGTLTLTNAIVSGNSAGVGGGLYNSNTGSHATITNTSITGNTATSGRGGGVAQVGGNVSLVNCAVTGNTGGGVSAYVSTLSLNDCTVSGNTTTYNGGGLWLRLGTSSLTDVTVSGNSARSGGGLAMFVTSPVTLTNVTVSSNTATTSGGGLFAFTTGGASSSPTLKNTIVAGNTATTSEPDYGGPVISQGHNLIGKTDGSSGWVGSDLTGTIASPLDPRLAALANNGGPTQTMALLTGSPAIHAGLAGVGIPTLDQRGAPRIGAIDIGAYQVLSSGPLVVNSTSGGILAGAGKLTLSEAVTQADYVGGTEAITFDPTVFATPQTITLTGTQLELSDSSGPMAITGPAAGVTISAGGLSRVIQIDSFVTASLSGLTFTDGNVTGNGGGLWVAGTTSLTNCTVSGSTASGEGGGLFNNYSQITLSDCVVSGNTASTGDGGGLFNNNGKVTLTNSSVSGNSDGSQGGGLFNRYGTLALTDCTISGNSSAHDAGGLMGRNGSTTLTDCTISNNTAVGYSGGFQGQGPTTVTDCTITNNTAGKGGGVLVFAGSFSIGNTIVANNTDTTSGPDVTGTFVSLGHNLIGKTDTSTGWVGSDMTGTIASPLNPKLGPLGYYGGPTRTVALLPGSPALGVGDPSDTVDQRGAKVPAGTVPSIGAFEGIGLLVTSTGDNGGVNPVANAGTGTLRQAIVDADAAGASTLSTIAFALPGGGPYVIAPTGSLPTVAVQATIDGTTQTGLLSTPVVQILGNSGDGNGLVLGSGSNGSIVKGLIISGFASGAAIQVLSTGDTIQNDFLGTNLSGTAAVPDDYGISVQGNNSTIGGTTTAARNLISGNLLGGLVITTGSGNLIEGNRIGTSLNGTNPLGNAQFGIQLSGAPNNTIGGTVSGAGNTIAATQVLAGSPSSGWGIDIIGASSGSLIEGNTIGGVTGLGNAGSGIFDNLATITIGGTLAGAGNTIGYNGGFGISLAATASAESLVRQNRITGNTSGGISIGASGSAYNPPVLAEASIIGSVITVKGSAQPGAVLEFYIAAAGQGAVYLGTGTEGSLTDNNPATGSFTFSLAIPASVTASAGDSITAVSVATPISGTNPTLQNTTSTFASAVVSDSGPAFGGPVVNAGGGGTIVAGSTFTSQGSFTDTTSESWTATVNYGDGTGPQNLSFNPVTMTSGTGDQYSEIGTSTFNLSHVFAKAGSYAVVVNVTNDSGEIGTSDFTVNVASAPPVVNNTDIKIAPASNPSNVSSPTIINENQSVILTGKFTDMNPGSTHTVSIIWGDKSTSTATVDEVAGTFTATHTYLTPGTYNSASGIYTVEVTVDSSAGTTTSTTNGLFYVQVNDVPPSNLVLTPNSFTISEGGAVHLSGTFQAPGSLDTHVVTINWGDNSPTTTFNLDGGVLNFGGISHQYGDYAPGAAGTPYTISVSVNDLYQPLLPAKATATVLVNPVAPTQVLLTPSQGSISEGQSITLAGSFVAPGLLDHHVVSINWGDGTSPSIVTLGAGVNTFAGVNHTYAGNSLLESGHAFAITATIIDPARPTGSGVGTTSVIVNDIASTVSNLAVTYASGGPIPIVEQLGGGSDPQVNAGTTVKLTGSYTTPNPKDSYSLLVTWGDGTTSTVPTASFASHTFVASHFFADRALGILLDDIHVTVTDTENTTGSGDLDLAVAHVNPVEQIGSGGISTSGVQTLSAQTSGGDASPITSYAWTVTALNGTFSQSYTTPSLALPSVMDMDYLVQSTVTDSLGASSQTYTAIVHVLDNTTSSYQIPDPGIGVSAVFVSGLAGNHMIDGSSLSVPIVFDGNGQETYVGDDANDVFNLHTDLSTGIGNGGNNVFNLTPNCTLYADANGGRNTLNFSSSTYGVTFNLSQTAGQVQDVDPTAAPGEHMVSVDAMGGATFSTLVDSSGGGDTITAASNTTIIGSGGSNKVLVNSSTASPVGNVTVAGAADGDTLTATGPSIGNINFQGDSGTDTFTNMGTVLGTVMFNGGADTSTFINMGTVAGTVMFNGGADGSTFNNMGSVPGTLNFGGGSDSNTLINASDATLGTVIFTGDQGTDTLTNNGMVGVITYNGGSDADSLVNAAGASVGSITYNGGSDAGSLVNVGMVTGSITYNGGSDAGTLTNEGVVLGTVTYGGGSDADNFTNVAGATVGSVVFTGGADAGSLVNAGLVTGSITYNGGSDAGTLTNEGVVLGTVIYGGGSDTDSFTNVAGATVGSVVFTGGADAGSLVNAGMVTGSITYNGGSDAGSLVNEGTVSGTVVYTGGSDADSIVNQGTVGGITYTGGSDAGSLVNDGTVLGTVIYSGGSDSDSFINNGMLGTVVYNGGSDAGTLTNNGEFSTITYNGGSDSDTLTNTATGNQVGTINFQGDTGVDQLVNLGTLAGVVYNGGSDSDTLLNPGTVTGPIVFNGDSGADLLENGATVNGVFVPGTVGSITFNGGADTDTLLNPGTVTGPIVFTGDSQAGSNVGAMELVNTGSAGSITFKGDGGADQLLNASGSTVGSIVYNGGSDTNLLVNQASGVGTITFNGGGDANVLNNSGSGFGTIIFQGDKGIDTLVNTGSASNGSTSIIIYNGGADTGTLINTGSGLASITYNGDQGTDTLINEGSNIPVITFGGGADNGAFLNAGDNVATITYNGGADANIFNNDGTQVGTITYNGDQGSGYFLNNGSVATINYNGGSDTDTLVNNGVVGASSGGSTTGGIVFTGDTGADGLLNTAIGTINGLVFNGGSDSDTLVNQGTLTNASVNLQGDDGAGQFVNQLGGTVSTITYNAGSDTDAFINYGSLSSATYNGDIGTGSMYLDGTLNQRITYNGGADGDQLIIGPDAGVVSTINFNGDGGADLLAVEANGAQNITFQAGSDTANFWNFANHVSGLTFRGGAGADTFDNLGSNVTGIVFNAQGDTGTDTLYNSGPNVGTIVFTGGSDANTLTNSGPDTASIIYNAGSDNDTLTNTGTGVQSIIFNGDDGVDTVVNSASSVGTIVYNGGSDADSLTNSGTVGTITFLGDGPSATFTDSGSVGTLVFDGGSGMASLIYSAAGTTGSSVTFNGQGGGNVFVDSGSAASISVNLGSGNNQAVVMTGASGNVVITGGNGDNDYLFSGTPTAHVTVNQALFANAGTISTANGTSVFVPNSANPDGSGGGINTLDFSGYTGGGISLDLMNTATQTFAGGLSLTLTDPEGISNAIGTQYTNTIDGNLRPDVLSTADLPDSRLASQENLSSQATFTPDSRTQFVYLDFDTYTVAGDYVYTTADRAAILNLIQLDYYGPDPSNSSAPDFTNPWFDVQITDNLSAIPSNLVSTGQYATLDFNRTPPSGLPGGEASEIDLGNRDFGGYASIQINGMVGGGGQPAATSQNIELLTAKVGAHELGHLMGIRHSDAFGPIGFGVHSPPGSTEFNPTYDGADAAFETFDHLISSPATVGSTRFNDLRDLDFGPREAIKLAFASKGTTIDASTDTQSSMASALPIALAPLTVPNTDINLPDIEKGMVFQVAALDVEGSIVIDPKTGLADSDYYAISGQKGDVDTFEVDSQELGRLGGTGTIDSVLSVYNASGQLVAFNDDQYEGTDSLIQDFVLPATGTYYVKVSSFAATPGDPEYDPTNPASPLNPGNLASILNPLNPNFSQSALTSFLDAKAGTATGQYDLFIYRFGESDPTVANLNNVLVARGPGSILSGSTGTDVLMGPVGTVFNDTDQGSGSAVSIAPTVATPSVDLQSYFQDVVTLNGPTGSTAWNVTISYGDGSSPTTEQLPAGSTIGLNHLYHSTGNETVTVEIQTGAGTFETSVPVSVILAQSPTETLTSPGTGSQFLTNVPVSFSGSVQNPYVGVSYLVTWTFTNTANSSVVLTTSQTVSTTTATTSLGFSTSETFTTPGTYSVQLSIKDLTNGTSTTVQTIGGSPAQVNIIQFIATTSTVTAPNATYTGTTYSQATAQVVGADQNVLTSPTITYAYYLATDTGFTNPLSAVPTNAGSYQVVASFTGNATYAPSTSPAVAFTIGQAPLTVTIFDASKVYGVNDAASLAGRITGLQNNDAITATYVSTGSSATTNVGTYSITASLSGSATTLANYAVSYTNSAKTLTTGTLTVTAAPLTVTIGDASKVYGINDAASLGGGIAGLQNNDTITAGFASTGTSATANVGSYSITASLSGSATTLADYVVTYTNTANTQTTGTLTITADHTTTGVTSASGTSYWGTSVTLTANVADTDSGSSPLGTLEFYDGSTDLGHGTLGGSSGNQTTWSFSTSTLSPGPNSITAVYTPNGSDFLTSNNQANPFNEVVQGGQTKTTGSASSGTIFYGGAETFTATVLVGSTPAVGSVDFFDNTTSTDLGSVTLNSSGVATLTPNVPLPAGTQSISMNYAGGSGYTASSATVSVVAQASIYVLNPTASGALNVSGSSMVSVPGTVQVDSNSLMALVLSGNTKVTASKIGVVGGTSITGSSSISGTQVKDSSVSDPLANLPIPSATGMTTYPAVNIGGVTTQTISPGIYPSITLGGSAKLTMQPGIYVITGGGFSLTGGSTVTGSGVFLYNAGSNYNGGSGSTFGAFNLSAGTISLSPPTTGPYAGILLFQSRDNTKALSISGSIAANLGAGVIYAPSASLQLSGSAQIGTSGQSISSLIVNELILTGNTGAYQLTSGAGEDDAASTFNWITNPVLTVTAVDDTSEGLDSTEVADLGDAMTYLNQALESFGVNLSWAAPGTNADVTVHFATTTPAGDASDGVLGYTTPQNDVYFVTGWNYYTSSDPSQISAGQYDFTTLAIHELAHTIGLGESLDTNSVMYEYLSPGAVRRTFTDSNLSLIDTDADRFMKAANVLPTPTTPTGSVALTASMPAPAPVTLPGIRISPQLLDLALVSLDPAPDAASTLATANVHQHDVALDAVAQESFLVPLEIAQDFPGQFGEDTAPGSFRKPTNRLA